VTHVEAVDAECAAQAEPRVNPIAAGTITRYTWLGLGGQKGGIA
jgi:hypothetical protein